MEHCLDGHSRPQTSHIRLEDRSPETGKENIEKDPRILVEPYGMAIPNNCESKTERKLLEIPSQKYPSITLPKLPKKTRQKDRELGNIQLYTGEPEKLPELFAEGSLVNKRDKGICGDLGPSGGHTRYHMARGSFAVIGHKAPIENLKKGARKKCRSVNFPQVPEKTRQKVLALRNVQLNTGGPEGSNFFFPDLLTEGSKVSRRAGGPKWRR